MIGYLFKLLYGSYNIILALIEGHILIKMHIFAYNTFDCITLVDLNCFLLLLRNKSCSVYDDFATSLMERVQIEYADLKVVYSGERRTTM